METSWNMTMPHFYLRLVNGMLILVACVSISFGQSEKDTASLSAIAPLDVIPNAYQGNWEDETGVWRLEITKEYVGVNDKLWRYLNITIEDGVVCKIKISNKEGQIKEYALVDVGPGRMIVRDPYLMQSYQARIKSYDPNFQKIGIADLPSDYFGFWSTTGPASETLEIHQNGATINGQHWTYHNILRVAGKYRITFKKDSTYHLWVPYWLENNQLTGVLNPFARLVKQSDADAPSAAALNTQTDTLSDSGPRKLKITDMPNEFFGNWSTGNGNWILDIRPEYFAMAQMVFEYGNITYEDNQYIIEMANWSADRQSVNIQKCTFRFIHETWMEVTVNGGLFEVRALPYHASFHPIHLRELPNDLQRTWYHSSGVDSLNFSIDQRGVTWKGKKMAFDRIVKKDNSYHFTCTLEEKFRTFTVEQLEDNFLQVDLDGYSQRQLFSGQAPAINFGLIALLTLAAGVLIWLFIRWKTFVIQRRETRKRKQVELELKALRAQMNPHFLFNSLSSIQNLINKQDPDQANHYLSRFSRLMRKVLNNSESAFISLEEELSVLELYCELEALRFDFDYTIEVDPELDIHASEVPSMLLQPFVENAIHHGIGPAKNRGKLKIKFGYTNEMILCTIDDNGIGIEQSTSTTLQKANKKGHFGIRLAEERLKMIQHHYGQDLKIELKDKRHNGTKENGTQVDIYFPAKLS